MRRHVPLLRVILPVLWLGLLIGLAFIEAPLKFQAPGITIPLGLGIGRLVFFALETASWILLVAITALAFARPRVNRADMMLLAALWLVMASQSIAIRPALNARSDAVIAGTDSGGSWLHYGYIVTDVALLALLIVCTVRGARRVVSATYTPPRP